MKNLLLVVLMLPLLINAQSKKQRRAMEAQQKADELVISNLKNHIQYLSDDKLEGRSSGSKGEALAAQYIADEFKKMGLQPKGSSGYLQTFPILSGTIIDPVSYFKINGTALELGKEYTPLAYSAQKTVNGIAAIALREAKEPWFLDLKETLEKNKNKADFNIEDAIKTEAKNVISKGGTALIVYNSGNIATNIKFNKADKSPPIDIPVLYVTPQGFSKFFKDKTALLDIEAQITFALQDRTGRNVIGFIDNKASQTIIVGAHYDHLGFGDDGNTLDSGKLVRNGADDNASGIAGLLEIARAQTMNDKKKNNYLFIAFSGEELGLLGSKYWLDNTSDMSVNFMVNLDMIGRYDADRKLLIGGFGTSPEWKNVISNAADNKLAYQLDSVGAGPGDHASFYRKNIPVLFFSTGNHTDYHKATDDYDKINIDGEFQIVKLVNRVLDIADARGKLAFQKTADPQMLRAGATVSLGIIPDNTFTGQGLKIIGVTPKKTAESIGMMSGDILTHLGDFKIVDMNSYLQALSTFRKGDLTVVRIKRGTDEKVLDVEF